MSSSFKTFKSLHTSDSMLILPNAWDAESAILFQKNNYRAVGTSSAGVAASLGYADGEQMPFSDYLVTVRRITASVKLPVTIDMEMGYGKTNESIYANLVKLMELGVVGINLEDSTLASGKRKLREATDFAQTLNYLKTKLSAEKQALYINVRCDTFLLNVKDKEEETTRRLKVYESAGADGIFLPGISKTNDIARVVAETRLPLNVMSLPGLPALHKLEKLGVKRLSMGPFLHDKVYQRAGELAKKVIGQKSIASIL